MACSRYAIRLNIRRLLMALKDNELKISVVLPSLNPTHKLISTIEALLDVGFFDIIVINDGSSPEYDDIFKQVSTFPQCTLLVHETNLGKGTALKTAFRYLLERKTYIKGVVAADADGQHLASDILKCSLAMLDDETVIMGSRDFSKSNVPIKSYLGNKITSFVFKTGCGINLNDTQTGLRVFPFKHLPFLTQVKGERFEYETNMLLEMKTEGIPFKEVSIQTVYEDKNVGSHFNGFRDAFRIYKLIFVFMISSIISFLIDNGLFWLFLIAFANVAPKEQILISTLIARLVSSFFNFNFNKKAVFKHKFNFKRTFLRYYVLAITLLLISAASVTIISSLLNQEKPILITLIKILVDSLLFMFSFKIQRDWVFKKSK